MDATWRRHAPRVAGAGMAQQDILFGKGGLSSSIKFRCTKTTLAFTCLEATANNDA